MNFFHTVDSCFIVTLHIILLVVNESLGMYELFGTKPLPESKLNNSQLDHEGQIKFKLKLNHIAKLFFEKNVFKNNIWKISTTFWPQCVISLFFSPVTEPEEAGYQHWRLRYLCRPYLHLQEGYATPSTECWVHQISFWSKQCYLHNFNVFCRFSHFIIFCLLMRILRPSSRRSVLVG